jgi:transposase-like protein
MLTGVRWYVAYPLSTRHVEERLEERGVEVDHATRHRWGITESPPREAAFHRREHSGGRRWRLDETSIEGKGAWRSLSRAVEKPGQTIDVLLTEPRDPAAARRCLTQAIHRHGVPETMSIDGSDAHDAALRRAHEAHGTAIIIRPVKDFNNIVEQDHRAVKRVTRPLSGCKALDAAPSTLVGIELMPRRRPQQLEDGVEQGLTVAGQFYALAAYPPPRQGQWPLQHLLSNICDKTRATAHIPHPFPSF